MQIYVTVKRMGKNRPALARIPYEISGSAKTLQELLAELVCVEVERYCQKGVDVQVIPYLTAEEVEAGAKSGKVGFGRIYSEKKPELEEAKANALQCFEDGLIRVFQNETELKELNEPLALREGDTFTLIRLTFLAGRLW